MRKLKLFLTLLMVMLLSVGNVWGDPAVLNSVSTKEVTAQGNAGQNTSVSKEFGGVTCTVTKKSNNNNQPGFYTSSGIVRYYSGDEMTLSVASGNNITAITFAMNSGTVGTASVGTLSQNSLSWSGSAESVSFTGGGTVKITSITVTYSTSGPAQPTLSVDPTVIDFGTVEQNAVVASQTVEVSFANLTGSVTYSGLSGAFSASGSISATGDEITIAANTATIGNYSQTLTVQSAADSKSQDVTVKMNVVEPFDGLKLDFVLSANNLSLPTAKGSSVAGNYTYTIGTTDYTFYATDAQGTYDGGIYFGGSYTMIYVSNAFGLPAISGYKLVKVEASNSSGCSTTTAVSIREGQTSSDDIVSGGTAQTWGTQGSKYTYNLTGTEENTMYYLYVATKNCQLTGLSLYYEEVETPLLPKAAKPIFETGDESFLTSTNVTLACETTGAIIYYTTDGNDPTTSSSVYSAAIPVSTTTTIKAIAVADGYDNSAVAEKTFTKITPLTVAEAIAAIPNVDDVVNSQYVAGIVCTAGTSVNASGQMTYYISADGSEGTRLQIYLGKNINNTAFSSVSDLAIGDRVVVFGQLKNYKGTYEMNSGNYLVSKEGPAVATPVFDPNGGGFMGETDVTITCATDGSTIYYTLDGTNPTKSSTMYEGAIHLDATTTITAIAYVGEESSLVVAKEFTLTAPMTVADALTALDTEDPINNVAVAGIISTAPTANPSSGKLTYYISDDGSATDQLEVFNGYGLNGASFSAKTDLQVGDEVTVFGNLTIFNSTTKEFASGSRLLAFNRPVVAVTDIDLTESTAEVEEGKTVTLHASVVPANATNKTIVWSVQSGDTYASVDQNGVVIGIAAGEAVIRAASDEDATIFAECTVTVTEPAPLSPWASVYTSNVTLSTEGGTSASAAKVKFYGEEGDGYDAIKAGTGNAQGAVVVNVPAGATALHFHAYGWNSESVGLTVTAPTGVTVSPATEISINSNSGIASNSPFTLAEGSDPKTDAYYAVSLSGNTEATNITISATSGKRFVLFGVNQEGGLVPVLDHISISGDLDNKSYKAGDALNMTGLTVEATYTLGGVPQTPVDITEDENLGWSYDPLVENQTSVTITATYKGQTDDITINDLVVTSADPVIYVQPSLNVNFGTVTPNAIVEPKTITVTLQNVDAATATLGGTNPEAFSINKTNLLDGDAINISVVSTATLGNYSATITITDNASQAEQKVVNLSLSVEEIEIPVSTTSQWIAATDADLVDGAEVLITGVKADVTYAMSEQANNNRTTAAGTLAEGVFTPGDNTMAFTLVEQESGKFALLTSNGKYLYAASSSSNQLKTRDDLGDDGKAVWSISIDGENRASIVANCETTNWRNTMRFNLNNPNPPVFACYASATQNDIMLYVPKPVKYTVIFDKNDGSATTSVEVIKNEKVAQPADPSRDGYTFNYWTLNAVEYDFDTPVTDNITLVANWTENPAPSYTEVRNGLNAGEYYTMCLDKAVTAVQGGTIWRVLSKAQNGSDIILEEVEGTLDAGRPYIFSATATALEVAYSGNPVNGPINDELNNGLIGSFSQASIANNPKNYIIYNNALYVVNSNNVYVGAYRAYLDMTGVPAYGSEPQQGNAPRRRVTMAVHGEQVATGIDALNASDAPVKVLINGQLFIIRGEKMFDAKGQLVK